MPVTPSPFSNLPADAAHRFNAVLKAIQECYTSEESSSPKRHLDVGGYPCLFARGIKEVFPSWENHTLDQPKEDLPDYTSASGMKMPFDDACFDIVTSIDVFEHIPPEHRQQFISEMCRVSKQWVIFCAPFDHPQVSNVEKIYDNIYKEVFQKDHPWLTEHVDNGLPSLDETIKMTPDTHGCVRIIPSFDLMTWATLQGLSLICQYKGEWDTLYDRFDQDFSNEETNDTNNLCYRHLIILKKGEENTASIPVSSNQGGEHVSTLAELYAGMLRTMASQTADTSSPTDAINQRLKQALTATEKELENARTSPRPSSLIDRLFRGGS